MPRFWQSDALVWVNNVSLITLDPSELNLTFLALALLLLAAWLGGTLFERIGAPRVVGEIAGGMLLGASGLYAIFPAQMGAILQGFPEQGKVLNIFYQLGLVFLMFSSGFHTSLALKRENRRYVGLLLIGATVIPMAAGLFVCRLFESSFLGEAQNQLSFRLVFLISIAITSIPVISKIFFELDLMETAFSNTILTTSTLQDLLLWILLNLALDFAAAQKLQVQEIVLTAFYTICLFLGVVGVAGLLRKLRRRLRAPSFFTLTFGGLFLFIVLMNQLRINLMYSAFLFGYLIKSATERDAQTQEKMQSMHHFSFAFFVPIYFALVGVQVNVLNQFSFGRFLLFFFIAFALEFFGCIMVLAFTRLRRQAMLNFAVTMNARGGPGIVLATVAYQNRIINLEFFTVLILTTMLSSMLAGYWLRYQKKQDISLFTHMERESE